MMNSRFIADRSSELARKLALTEADDRQRIVSAYLWMLDRKPSEEEIQDMLNYKRAYDRKVAQSPGVPWNAWQSLCRILISSNGFIYVD